jgi:hypothetical protein
VSGWRRRHQEWGIDPEPLVIFTSWISVLDPRLRDESLDWCITYGRYLSRARLRNQLRVAEEDVVSAFGTFAATVNAHSTLNWPGTREPFSYEPTNRSHVKAFVAPALLALRLRALFGVSARAETIRVLMHTSASFSAAEIAEQIDYTKRNVADALESLRLADIVFPETHGNQIRYRFNRPELPSTVTPLPRWFPSWRAIFRVVTAVLSVDARESAFSKTARAVEARKAVDSMQSEILAAGLRQVDLEATGEDFWDAFVDWAEEVFTGLAFADATKAFAPGREPNY